jgi:hypothetical protein
MFFKKNKIKVAKAVEHLENAKKMEKLSVKHEKNAQAAAAQAKEAFELVINKIILMRRQLLHRLRRRSS